MQEFTLKIEGMMCPHCEANVKKHLEAFPIVDEVTASHTLKQAILKLNAQPSEQDFADFKKAVADAGYQVID
ncbi:MAG: heavy-metal-associated domain-containing protein [Oscillospiraceae bacterium]|nr:heavy-metal-associated domain-containing protein [Oscillospiraceae bacterium]MBR7083988.1 heavy-metal-associated domain-containing protein [Oscillospiraceae bacterium]